MKSLLILLVVVFHSTVSLAGGTKTPVEIISLSRENPIEMSVSVMGATTSSQLVVLLRFSNRPGLWVASSEGGEPNVPMSHDFLPEPGVSSTTQEISTWDVAFQVEPKWGRVQEIYAIVCTVKDRQDWSRTRDYKSFSYLPFSRAKDIDGALEILRDFGWIPTGLTKINP